MSVLIKYNEIWNKIKKTLNIKFHSVLVFDEKYIKVKVKESNGVVNTNFCGNKVPKEGADYTCISIDTVMKMKIENYSSAYLEECKYRGKKKKMPEFIDVKLESDSSSDSE